MSLQIKSVIFFNIFIALVCLCMGVLGYRSADEGFGFSLQMKAESNVQSILEILQYKYPGDWKIINGTLYKGDEKISGNENIVDLIGDICKGHVTIFQNDTRVATTVKKADGQRSTGTKASEKVINEVLKNGKSYTGVADVLGSEYNCAYAPIKDKTGQAIGMMYVGLPAAGMDIQKNFVISVIISTLIIMVVLGIFSWIVIGRSMKKLSDVSNSLEQVAGGNLQIVDLPIESQDEIGSLSQSLNNMKGKLKKLINNVAASAEHVAASSEELTASGSQAAESIHQVANNVIQMTEGTTKQSETINELQEDINVMNSKIADLFESAKEMNEVAGKSQETALDGKKKVNFAVDQIKSIADQVNKSAEVVKTLGKRSDEIGTIVDTISEIADQTNLLALNAAIEAARAGEHGRGFAVVADEVRKLAEQSSNAAKNISALIGAIQDDTKSAVEAIELGNKSVHEGAKSVTDTGSAFNAIEEQVEKLNENVQRSIAHIEEVNKKSKEILNSIEVVRNISERSTEDAQNVSAMTEEQTATINEMSDASGKLAELAQQLQNEVHKFRI
ncbi:MAG: methyl-accepting chemotaxis protein [Selenomonadaceae bacterium]|nr:methyl-accepting chemotaxis protein [Selenomonadaceae bacterium]